MKQSLIKDISVIGERSFSDEETRSTIRIRDELHGFEGILYGACFTSDRADYQV
jgi:hypothetical protein